MTKFYYGLKPAGYAKTIYDINSIMLNHCWQKENYGIFDNKEKALDKAQELINENKQIIIDMQKTYGDSFENTTGLILYKSQINPKFKTSEYLVKYNIQQSKIYLSQN